MPRPRGSRNKAYDQKRRALLDAVVPRMLAPGGANASMRELAAAAEASVPTLRHYFGTREALVVEALAHMSSLGARWLELAATCPPGDPRTTLLELLRLLKRGWDLGMLSRMVSVGLEAGLGDAAVVGPGYVNGILEPLLQAVEERLAAHVARGDLRPCDPRFAGLALMSPVLMALLHQDALGGRSCRPLDVDAFLVHHVDRFVAAYGAEAS